MEKFGFFNKFKDAVIVLNDRKEVVYRNNAFKRIFSDFNDIERFSHKLNFHTNTFCPLSYENVNMSLPVYSAIISKEEFSAQVNYQNSQSKYFYFDLTAFKRNKYTIIVFSDISAEIELEKTREEYKILSERCEQINSKNLQLSKSAKTNQTQAIKMTLINKISNIIRESIDASKVMTSTLFELSTILGAFKAYYASITDKSFKIEEIYTKNKDKFINQVITFEDKIYEKIIKKETIVSNCLKEYKEAKPFDAMVVRVILPIYHLNNLLGVVVFLTRQRRELIEEIDILESVSAQIGNAIIRATLFNEIKEQKDKLENTLQELKTTQLHLIQSEKMVALGQLVAGVAHEINTPIASIKSNNAVVNKLLEKLNQENLKDFLKETNQIDKIAIDRINKLVFSLKRFVRLDEAELQEANINDELDLTLELIRHETKNKVEIVKDYGDVPKFYCYPNGLNQVFMNLLMNACHAIEKKGKIFITTRFENEELIVKIKDTGVGIKPENLDKIFATGFTTKKIGQGSGWGLAICSEIIKQHKGTINVESVYGQGAEFTIIMPKIVPINSEL